jgi:hypothetical protein
MSESCSVGGVLALPRGAMPASDSANTIPFVRHELQDPLGKSASQRTPAPVLAKPRALAAAIQHPSQIDYGQPNDTQVDPVRPGGTLARRAATPRNPPSLKAQRGELVAKNVSREPSVEIAPDLALEASGKWHEFEAIGLGNPPSKVANTAAKLAVSTYRLVGFGVLTLIVLVLLGYIGTTAFYFLSKTWVTPVDVSPSDEKVVALQMQLATQLNEREKLIGDLDQAERAAEAEQAFQLEFARAIKLDLSDRQHALAKVRSLADSAASVRAEIRRTNDDYSVQTVSRMQDEYKAGLIDRQQMLAGKYQLAQITSSNLSLAERQAEFEQRAAQLRSETKSLDAILADKEATGALSYDVLKIKRDYDASKLELQKDVDARKHVQASIARIDKIIDSIKQSAYLRAVNDRATVALVPYSNLENVAKGTKLYGCRFAMVGCHEVGTVIEVLPGEIQLKHPHRDTMLRGRMIEMQLTDGDAAQDEVLFAGGKPLWL